jgi:hypothetical protein
LKACVKKTYFVSKSATVFLCRKHFMIHTTI